MVFSMSSSNPVSSSADMSNLSAANPMLQPNTSEALLASMLGLPAVEAKKESSLICDERVSRALEDKMRCA